MIKAPWPWMLLSCFVIKALILVGGDQTHETTGCPSDVAPRDVINVGRWFRSVRS